MRWSVLLLILMGHSSIFVCHLYEYHFIKGKKTWDEAQRYCRENYNDLATVHTMTDMKRLKNSNNNKDAWIRLRCNLEQSNIAWNWTQPGLKYNETNVKWSGNQPKETGKICEDCVSIIDGRLYNLLCAKKCPFICYNETNKGLHLIVNQHISWTEAQCYCGTHHTDLANEMDWNKLNPEQSTFYWIGLSRKAWLTYRVTDERKCTKLNESGKLVTDSCDHEIPFICYDDKTILITENKTWEEALSYCRDNNSDLVSITNPDEQIWVQDKAKNASSPYVWLGLRYTCALEFWFWVSDEAVKYKNWASSGKNDYCDMSGAMDRGGEHKWFSHPDETKYNFICTKR